MYILKHFLKYNRRVPMHRGKDEGAPNESDGIKKGEKTRRGNRDGKRRGVVVSTNLQMEGNRD